jgi:hypothetical protein
MMRTGGVGGKMLAVIERMSDEITSYSEDEKA